MSTELDHRAALFFFQGFYFRRRLFCRRLESRKSKSLCCIPLQHIVPLPLCMYCICIIHGKRNLKFRRGRRAGANHAQSGLGSGFARGAQIGQSLGWVRVVVRVRVRVRIRVRVRVRVRKSLREQIPGSRNSTHFRRHCGCSYTIKHVKPSNVQKSLLEHCP